MPADFYSANPPTWLEFLTPMAMPSVPSVLVFAAVGYFLLRRGRPARIYDTFLWLGCGLLSTVYFVAAFPDNHARFFTGFLGCVWLITPAGMGFSLYHLSRQQNSTGLVMAISSPAFLGLLLYPYLLPPQTAARNATKRTICKNNLKQMGLAMYNYHASFQSFPPQQTGEPPQSWRLMILPYIEASPMYNLYHHDLAWDSPENAEFAKFPIATYQCPSQKHHRDDKDRWLTSYAVLIGPHSIWREDGPLSLKEITDGESNTMAIVEACGQNIVWNEPRDIDLEKTPLAINLAGNKQHESPGIMSSLHHGGANILMADGTVRFVSMRTDPQVLKALITADSGDVVGEF